MLIECVRRPEQGGIELREIEASGCVVLACRSCEERMVLLGGADDWHREGRETFECGGCGRELALAEREVEARSDAAGLAPGPS